ncbi:unnamed protein product [Victoria cruziana]
MASRIRLLHGRLDIWIFEAKNLPDRRKLSKNSGERLRERLVHQVADKVGRLRSHGEHSSNNIYVSVSISNAVVARTKMIPDNENAVWKQQSLVPVAHQAAKVLFSIHYKNLLGSLCIGTVSIPVEQIYSGNKVEGLFELLGPDRKPRGDGIALKLSIQYIPIEKMATYGLGIAGLRNRGIPDAYFPLRKGGRVTLYQDADVPLDCLPTLLTLHGDMRYHHGRCWREMYEAMEQARRFIYITGWSAYPLVGLVREQGRDFLTLGDLLKKKSQEGVRVLLLVWDDPTSWSIFGHMITEGKMGTGDEELRRFFKHSSVHVLLCTRRKGKHHSLLHKGECRVIYTHHQKSVVLDSDAGSGKRKVIAFLGGLDLCRGRYDTPDHPLFRTSEVHKEDYHNPTFPEGISAPRQPWHDLHCKIDGPAAYDVLKNFEERWLKASKPHGLDKLKRYSRSEDDNLLKLSSITEILAVEDAPYLDQSDPEAWHVQIFRSIDSNSVKGFPKDPERAMGKGLTCGKNNIRIDMSIHTAYVEAIRAAQRFIYIENQYFIGSSYNWSPCNGDHRADNLIPMEIALKITEKIKAKERFSAYVVIPMWPEGVPTEIPIQGMLYFQRRTMEMMYDMIYRALEEVGLENTYHPRDYLTFFCLGNREAEDGSLLLPSSDHADNVNPAQRNRRFMIYVHSKGMIVDDEYVILGSANINQRSLDGSRDTEIAMGAYQPLHLRPESSDPHGQIYGYRMSLWAEHLGVLEKCFRLPESLECMRRINQLAELNWQQFVADDVTDMRGHLLRYPVDIDSRGKVKALEGCETFPDCGGRILGNLAILATKELRKMIL